MYEPLVNSEAKLAVIPAKTKWDSIHSRVLLLKVNDSIKAIVFNMFSRLNQTDSSNFTGEITIRGLNGSIIAGYRVIDGNIDIQYLPSVLNVTANKSILKSDSANAECRSFCGHQASDPNCICNIQYLDPVVVTAPSSNPMPVITA